MSTLFVFESQNPISSSQSHSEADSQHRLQDHDWQIPQQSQDSDKA